MKNIIALALALLAAPLFAEHIYPDNPDPINTAFFGQLNRDSRVVTNGIRSVDGAARPLPKYLHLYKADDSYPDAAAEYYRSRGNGKTDGGCSSVRDGGFLYRNFDYPFDDRAEFVVRMSAGPNRFASVGVAQVGTNLTEQIVTSGKWSKWYKALPGATVDGINEKGVACNINVVGGAPAWKTVTTAAPLHPLAAVRWILDNATNAQHAATYIADNIRFPIGWTQNFHYMIADEHETWIVENGDCVPADWIVPPLPVIANFAEFNGGYEDGQGYERHTILAHRGNITNVWYTNAYRRETNPPWVSDLAEVIAYTNEIFNAWATHPKEYFRNKTTNCQPWWQTVHTSIYDLTNRVLRVSVQETDDWYTFQVPSSGAKVDAYTKAQTDAKFATKAETDRLLAGKANTEDIPTSVMQFDDFDSEVANAMGARGISQNEIAIPGPISGTEVSVSGHSLSDKANRPALPVTSGNIAALDENGDLANSGISKDDVAIGRNEDDDKFGWDGRVFNICITPSQHTRDIPVFSFDVIDGIFTLNSGTDFSGIKLLDAPLLRCTLQDFLDEKADVSMISATDQTFSNAVMSVATGISTNDWAVIASVADWASVLPGGVPTGAGTLGAVLAALAAAVLALKKKTSLLKSDGTAEDDFADDLFGKQVAKTALMIPLEAKTDSFVAEDGHAYAVTMTGTVTITMPTTTEGKAAIFQARFSAAAQQSVQFDTDDVVKFDGTDCGIVKAGKDALLSAMWNGEAWDLVWKNEA